MDRSTPAANALHARGTRAGLKAGLLVSCINDAVKAAWSAAVMDGLAATPGRFMLLFCVAIPVIPKLLVLLTAALLLLLLTGGQLAED